MIVDLGFQLNILKADVLLRLRSLAWGMAKWRHYASKNCMTRQHSECIGCGSEIKYEYDSLTLLAFWYAKIVDLNGTHHSARTYGPKL